MWARANDGVLLVCVLTLFICRAVVASHIVSPWQGADEPNHFALSKVLTTPIAEWKFNFRKVPPVESVKAAEVERQVLQSMARHGWWEAYDLPTPDPLPTDFTQVNTTPDLGIGTYDQPLFYGLAAAVLRITQPPDIEAEYHQLRMLCVALAVAALGFGWAGTRLLFGSLTAIGSTAVAAMNPQFLLTALSVNPDALVALFGAVIWWQVACVAQSRRKAFSAAIVLVTVVAALLTKRSALPLAPAGVLALVMTVVAQGGVIKVRRTLVMAASAVVLAVGVLFLARLMLSDGSLADLLKFWSTALTYRRPADETTLAAFMRIVPISIDHAWLAAGLARFRPSETWLLVVRVLTVAGFVGAVGLMVSRSEARRELCLAWLFVALQLAGVYLTAYRNIIVPDGRLLFPVLVPACVLLWVGVTWAVPTQLRRHAPLLIVGLAAALDVTGFTLVLAPAYLH